MILPGFILLMSSTPIFPAMCASIVSYLVASNPIATVSAQTVANVDNGRHGKTARNHRYQQGRANLSNLARVYPFALRRQGSEVRIRSGAPVSFPKLGVRSGLPRPCVRAPALVSAVAHGALLCTLP